MSNVAAKRLRTAEQLVAHLKSRGVAFELCSETDAADYLVTANNYLRTCSYRKLYPVYTEGPKEGKYIGLDFGALITLSSVDRVFRTALRDVALDVEHFARVRLLNLEVIEFGRFCDLWLFCAKRWEDERMRQLHYVLRSIKALRNSVCHNRCIINGLSSSAEPAGFPMSTVVTDSMNELGLRNSKMRRAKMRNLRVAHVAATLYGSYEFCSRESTRSRHASAMDSVRKAFDAARPACPADGSLTSYFDFVVKLVDIWMPKRA